MNFLINHIEYFEILSLFMVRDDIGSILGFLELTTIVSTWSMIAIAFGLRDLVALLRVVEGGVAHVMITWWWWRRLRRSVAWVASRT